MQENLAITKGCVKARERSLRLVRRVAVAIDELDHHPTHEEVIQLCSANTIKQCLADFDPDFSS